ncbi:hypothetical protein FS837_011473 [Tulasnella sp. UAMH 9824]|nr:hypothetical protein FS837_011473 [Tulasnella sp. UAMH 9824]
MDTKPEQLPDSSAHLSYFPEPQTAIPPPFQEKTALSPNQTWATRPARLRLLDLLPAAAVIITTFGFVVAILSELLVHQCVQTQGGRGILPAIRKGAFYTVEDHKRSEDSKLWILTISNAATQVISGTSAIVMALVAYRVGAEWLRLSKSQSTEGPAETPSPAQYGMLVRLLGSSSVLAIVQAFAYTARTWNRRLPKIFKNSLWLATLVWVLARLIGLADLWLHYTSDSERSNATLPEPPSSMPPWGVSFNQSICTDMISTFPNSTSDSPPEYECLGPYEYFISNVAWGHDIAFDVMTNSTNAPFHIGTVERDTAFVFPGPRVVDLGSESFIIPTFATRATCSSLNRVCAKDPSTNLLDCTAAGYPGFPYFPDRGNGTASAGRVVDRVLGVVVGNDLVGEKVGTFDSVKAVVPSNPVKLAVQLQWETLEQGPLRHNSAANQDLAVDDPQNPTLYAGCNLTFFDAFVQWDSRKHWSLLNTTESSAERTATLWLPIVWQYGTELMASNLMYTARRNSTAETMFALGQELATLTLATAAGFYKPGPASEVYDTEMYFVSKYPVLPIAAYLFLLCVYGVITSVLLLQVYRTPDEAIIVPGSDLGLLDEEMEPSMLSLAQRWLTNPMPLVGYSFAGGDGQDGARSAAYSAINTAYDGNEGHRRLTIGLVGDRFGVKAWGQR